MTDRAPERHATDTAADAGEPAPAERSPDNIAELAVGWFSATRERARSVTHLALAEARLAALSVALMTFLGVLAAVCVLGAWGLLVAGIAYGLVQAGLALWAVLLGLAVLHVIAAYVLWRMTVKLTRHLQFTATRAQIRPEPDAAT